MTAIKEPKIKTKKEPKETIKKEPKKDVKTEIEEFNFNFLSEALEVLQREDTLLNEKIGVCEEIEEQISIISKLYAKLHKQENPEFCEYCKINVKNMKTHIKTKTHLEKNPSDAFLLLKEQDEKIGHKVIKEAEKKLKALYSEKNDLSPKTRLNESILTLEKATKDLEQCFP